MLRARIKRIGTLALCGATMVTLVALVGAPASSVNTCERLNGALALYGRGDREGARYVSEQLIRVDKTDPDTWLLVGMLAEDRHAKDDAVRAYETALGLLDPADSRAIDVRVSLADQRRRKGDAAGALAELEKVARETGESQRVKHARVLALVDLRQFDLALSETHLIAEERDGGGVAKRLEQLIRSSMDAAASRKN